MIATHCLMQSLHTTVLVDQVPHGVSRLNGAIGQGRGVGWVTGEAGGVAIDDLL